MAWLTPRDGGIELVIRVTPGARKNAVEGLHGDALKIRLQAPPVDGKANRALGEFLADALGVSKSAVALVAGETSRTKRVRVAGCTIARAEAALLRP